MTYFQILRNEQRVAEEISLRRSNWISTTLYNIYNFIPLGIWNQVKQPINLYFIIIAVVALIPQVSAIDPYSAVIPTVWVILFSLCFDWYDDLKRYLQNRKVNNQPVELIRNGQKFTAQAKDIRIGDYLYLKENERAMADLVLVSYTSTKDYCYIDTSNLDGEKTLKPKYAILEKNLPLKKFLKEDPLLSELSLDYRENVDDLHTFEGNVQLDYNSE